MAVSRLWLENVRNIRQASLELSPGINLISGPNGAGKTSVLEAAFLLSSGRSFRTSRLNKLIREGESCCIAGAELRHGDSRHRLGIERCRTGTRLRLDGQDCRRLSELARELPALCLHPESYRIIAGGPQLRRQFLDWGLFHVKPGFHGTWQRYRKALRQRNSALKRDPANADRWNGILATEGERLDEQRQWMIQRLAVVVPEFTADFLLDGDVAVHYQRGWPADTDLATALAGAAERDRQRGFTTAGPHRADLRLHWAGRDVQEYVSRGQQKMLTVILLLAMEKILHQGTDRLPLMLIDDPASELDADHRGRLLDYVGRLENQCLVTAIRREDLALAPADMGAMFHVEQGIVNELV